jgi:opacity protein-like surface antigen
MKKILLLVSSTLMLANAVLAQDAADKKFRFGLKVTPTPTWLRSNDTKLVSKSGTKFGFGFGLQMEFRINSTAAFVTGIGGDFLGGKQTYNNGQGYILDKDNNYVDSKTIVFTKGADQFRLDALADGTKLYELKSRSIKATYVTIPVLLKLMTKDISGFKYFGMFGGNIAIQTKFRASDEVTELIASGTGTATVYNSGSSPIKIDDMRPSGDLVPVNVALNVGIGAEYNLSGSTSVFLSINYIRGFINQYQGTSEIMVDKIKENITKQTKPANSKQSAFSDGLQINIGLLF